MLINVKNHYVFPLKHLARVALRYVYDKKHMKPGDENLMQNSIVHWANKIDINEDEMHKLQMVAKLLKQNDDGELDERKDLFKKHGINWAQFHRVPDMKELGNDIS